MLNIQDIEQIESSTAVGLPSIILTNAVNIEDHDSWFAIETVELPMRNPEYKLKVTILYDTGCGSTLGQCIEPLDVTEGRPEYTKIGLKSLGGIDDTDKRIYKIRIPIKGRVRPYELDLICPNATLPRAKMHSHKVFTKLRRFWPSNFRFVDDTDSSDDQETPCILLGVNALDIFPTDVTSKVQKLCPDLKVIYPHLKFYRSKLTSRIIAVGVTAHENTRIFT